MTSPIAMRAILGASLGFGLLDVAWINLSLASQLVESSSPPAIVARPALDPPAPPPPAPPVNAPQPIVERVYFATNAVGLDAQAQTVLKQVVERAGAHGTIKLEGYADQRGDEAFNRTLSKRRAFAVEASLSKLGIARARISISYGGEGEVLDATELWRDRRVDIEITGEPR